MELSKKTVSAIREVVHSVQERRLSREALGVVVDHLDLLLLEGTKEGQFCDECGAPEPLEARTARGPVACRELLCLPATDPEPQSKVDPRTVSHGR